MNNNDFQYKGFTQHPQQQSNFNQIREQNSGPMEWNLGQQNWNPESYIPDNQGHREQNRKQWQDQEQTVQQIYYFKPSTTFKGTMTGWYFGTGQHGTGYYMDLHQL